MPSLTASRFWAGSTSHAILGLWSQCFLLGQALCMPACPFPRVHFHLLTNLPALLKSFSYLWLPCHHLRSYTNAVQLLLWRHFAASWEEMEELMKGSSERSSASQSVLNPSHCLLTYLTFPMLHYKDIVGDSVKSLGELKVHNITSTRPAMTSQKATRSVKHAFPLVNPCWLLLITFFSSTCLETLRVEINYTILHSYETS